MWQHLEGNQMHWKVTGVGVAGEGSRTLSPLVCCVRTQALGKYRRVEKETDMLLSTLSAMQEKAQHLECNLSAETRIKLDLFSVLGDTRRQLEIAQGLFDFAVIPIISSGLALVVVFLSATRRRQRPPCNTVRFLCVCVTDKVIKQDREIREMKQKIAEVMAVSPGVSYAAPRPPVPQYLTKLLNSERYMLTPRALMYQCLRK